MTPPVASLPPQPPPRDAVVNMTHVSHHYGKRMALSNVSLVLQPGVVGLLGPNGAGKTTLLQVAAGLLVPTGGTVTWLDGQQRLDPRLDNRISMCTDGDQLPRRQSPLQWLTGLLRLSGASALDASQRASQVLDRLGLTAKRDTPMAQLSRGQRQRVKLAQAFSLPVALMLLDEPLNALDPVWRSEVAALMHEAADAGTCVVVSSHILEEVEQLAGWLVLLAKGRLVASGALRDIQDLVYNRGTLLEITCPEPRALGRELLALAPVTLLRMDGTTLTVQASDVAALTVALPRAVVASGQQVIAVTSQGDDLTSLFQALNAEVR